MYESFDRRRNERAAEREARREISVDAHVGSIDDFMRRLHDAGRTAARGERRDEFHENVFPWAIDARNLKTAWNHLKDGNGHAPGIDGMTFEDIPDNRLWGYLRDVHDRLDEGTYEPQAARIMTFPKGPGKGIRTLHLPTVEDRMVGRAIVQAVQSFIDPSFDHLSFGFRPGRGRIEALAHAEHLATSQNRLVWATEDVENAFPNLPKHRLMDLVHRRFRNQRLADLIEQLIGTVSGHRGIPQGQPLSPLLLNLYLDRVLDRPWRRNRPSTPLIRVVDDLLVLCESQDQAENAHRELQRLLIPAGMPVKGTPETAIRDLSQGGRAEWLGLHIRQAEGTLQVNLSERAWHRLQEKLALAHEKPDPPRRAEQAIWGWLEQGGLAIPAEDLEPTLTRVEELGRAYAFEELPQREELVFAVRRGQQRYEHALRSLHLSN